MKMVNYTVTVTKGMNVNTGLMTYEYDIPAALVPSTGKVYGTVVNRVVGNQTFLLAATEYTILTLNGEANNYAYRGKMKMYFAAGFTYIVHQYQQVNGNWREFAPDTVNAVAAAQTAEYTWEDTESVRMTVECDNIAGSADYEYGYDRKEE